MESEEHRVVEQTQVVVDTLTLRFNGEDRNGSALHELRAAHVADVLQGLVGISSDFAKAGAFGNDGLGSEILVRPPEEGSFLIEVVRIVQENWETIETAVTVGGPPTLGQIIWWSTKSARADVKDYSYLDNGMVKVVWQDDVAQEVPVAAWNELQKRQRRRRRHLRQIMTPLSDPQVSALEIEDSTAAPDVADDTFTLRRADYDAVRPEDEVEESTKIFDVEAQMSAIDFDDPTKWKVKTSEVRRTAIVTDGEFLGRVANGLAIRKSDIFRLRVREDTVKKNGRTSRTWTVLQVESHRRAAHDNDDA